MIARAERWGAALLPWRRLYRGDERDCPHALTVAGGALIRARNEDGALAVSHVANPGPDSAYGAWSELGVAEPGTGVALAARGSDALLAYVAPGGRELAIRESADGGASWAAERTLVHESSAIARAALAIRSSNGDACAFYTQGASTLKRLRRSAGQWHRAGTDWTRGGDVSALSGVAALHDGADYRLIVSGRARSPRTKQVWSCLLGDGGFPADLWSGLNVIAESDAASAREFAGPGVVQTGGVDQRACFAALDSGGEPSSRVYTSYPPALSGGNPGDWSEPEPHEADSAHGLAVAADSAANVWGATPNSVWRAGIAGGVEVSARLVEASFRLAPFSTRARLTLDNADGALNGLPDGEFAGLTPGGTVEIAPGYRSGADGGAEYGLAVHAAVERVRHEAGGGSARVVVECSGHWERIAAWRAPQVWQSPAGGLTREALFRRLCGKAGIRVSGAGWSASRPGFAVSPGESGLSAARRLLEAVGEAVIPDGDGLAVPVFAKMSGEEYGEGGHPITSLSLHDAAPATNWVRAHGPDRAADAHDFASIYRDGHRLRLVRSADAASDAEAREQAAAALARERRERSAGQLVVPFHAGQELFDAITVTDERLGLQARTFRAVELGMEYSRRPGHRPRYDSIIGLGEQGERWRR